MKGAIEIETNSDAVKVIEKVYVQTFENGTKTEFTLKATIENYSEADMETVLTSIAQSPRQFYLEVAKELNSKP